MELDFTVHIPLAKVQELLAKEINVELEQPCCVEPDQIEPEFSGPHEDLVGFKVDLKNYGRQRPLGSGSGGA